MKSLIGTDMADNLYIFFALGVPIELNLSVYIIDYLYFTVYLALFFTICFINLPYLTHSGRYIRLYF